MKTTKLLFEFPDSLPNDIEGYVIFFRKKFPRVINNYEEIVKKFWNDPSGLEEHCNCLLNDLWVGWKIIKDDFYRTKKADRDPKFLLNIDMRLQKLNCFRFWIINYALCEGPIHSFYINLLSSLVEKFIIDDNQKIELKNKEHIERILLKGDYKDLYLVNALKGIDIYESLKSYKKAEDLLADLEESVSEKNDRKSYDLSEKIVKLCLENRADPKLKRVMENIQSPLKASEVKGDFSVVCGVIMSSVEFREKNLELKREDEQKKTEIEKIFSEAKAILNDEEFEQLQLSYLMLMKLKKFKDNFGAIDPEWIPFWFRELLPELEEKINAPKGSCVSGQGSTFYSFPWYFGEDLLKIVFRMDSTDFDIGKV